MDEIIETSAGPACPPRWGPGWGTYRVKPGRGNRCAKHPDRQSVFFIYVGAFQRELCAECVRYALNVYREKVNV